MSRVIVRPLNIITKPGTSGSNLSLGSLIFTGNPGVALVPQALVAIGGTGPFTYSAIGLPAVISVAPLTGVISGTPTLAGVTTATATVTDSLGAMASAPVLFDIVAIPPPPSAYFADEMISPDQPFYVGNYWGGVGMQGNLGVISQGILDGQVNRTVNGLALVNGSPVYSPQQTWLPTRMNNALIWGVAQFAEFVPVSMSTPPANGQSNMGPVLFWDSNAGSGYFLEVDNLTTGLTRWFVSKTFSAFAASTVLIANTPSDYLRTMRLEVVPGVGQNTITVFENGVQVGTVVDNTAPIPVSGIPGMQLFIRGGQNGTIKNFKCGTLPQTNFAPNFP